jgi:cysteine-rich repeat protein
MSCTVCNAVCQAVPGETAFCGDTTTDAGFETCDDGNAMTEVCTYGQMSCTVCDATCDLAAGETAYCGDGTTDPGFETCDDANAVDTDACPTTCQMAACGDGFVRTGVEECDDGNLVDTDACPTTCEAAACGDGFVQAGVEACDDGNTSNGDGCNSNCQLPLENPSFETGDYTGWTLQENSGNPTAGAWAIGVDGTTLTSGQMVFDFTDGVSVPTSCIFQSFVLDATNGTHLALQIQTGPENHRMWQDIVLAPGLTTLSWDMGYHTFNTFEPTQQFLAVHLRDPNTDAILTTLYKTGAGDPLTLTMTTFSRNISAFAGMPVRIDVEMQVQLNCFDGQFDNFVLN